MSLGSLSTLYNGLRPEPRRRIAEGLGLPHPVLRSWLHFLTYLRNVCAHHARLWDRELAIRPEIPRKDSRWTTLGLDNSRAFCALPVLEWIHSWCRLPDANLGDVRRTLNRITATDPRFPRMMGMPPLWDGGRVFSDGSLRADNA